MEINDVPETRESRESELESFRFIKTEIGRLGYPSLREVREHIDTLKDRNLELLGSLYECLGRFETLGDCFGSLRARAAVDKARDVA